MHASIAIGAMALLTSVHAIPAPTEAPSPSAALARRDGEEINGLSPWVSVNDEAQPVSTYTPVWTTADGTSSVVDAAPFSLTASVYTLTSYAKVSTSTGLPPNPTAVRNGHGEGAFSLCSNKEGENAPFCRPSHNTTLETGNTYYITWDPEYYNSTIVPSNSTLEVAVRLDWFNHTSENPDDWSWVKIDTYNRRPAYWGFFPLELTSSHLADKDPNHHFTNASISLVSSFEGSDNKNTTDRLLVTFSTPQMPHDEPTTPLDDQTLYIALPAALGGALLIVLGLFFWHRRTRKLGLGNVMGRGRNGYNSSRTRRMFRRGGAGKTDGGAIQLDLRDPGEPLYEYHDNPQPPRMRRGSDDLGSLAGSPVVNSFSQSGAGGGRNAFRDEMDRQHQQRRGEDVL